MLVNKQFLMQRLCPWTPTKLFIKLKASIPLLHTNSTKSYDIRYLAVFLPGRFS